jgi:hypothetical protein
VREEKGEKNSHPISNNNSNSKNITTATTVNCLILGLKWAPIGATDDESYDRHKRSIDGMIIGRGRLKCFENYLL